MDTISRAFWVSNALSINTLYLPANASCYSDNDLVYVEQQRTRVTEQWTKFHSRFKLGNIPVGDGPPTIETLQKAVQNSQNDWTERKESGFGKVKMKIENFLNTMNDHSYLFNVIPSGDKYVSLITGVISSVVKVCVFFNTYHSPNL